MSFVAAIVTAVAFKGRFRSDEPFVLELPPYRLPTLRQIVLRAWHEVRHFLRRATKFIVGGVVLIWLLTNLPAGAAPGSADTLRRHARAACSSRCWRRSASTSG